VERCHRLRCDHGGRRVAVGRRRRRRQRPVVGRRQLLLHRVHHAPPIEVAHLDQHLRWRRRCAGQALGAAVRRWRGYAHANLPAHADVDGRQLERVIGQHAPVKASKRSPQQDMGACLVCLYKGVQVVVGDRRLVGEGHQNVLDGRVR